MEEPHFPVVILLILFLMQIISFAFLQAQSLGLKWNVAKISLKQSEKSHSSREL